MPFATFRSSAVKDISSTSMYILRPEIDITLLRDAISESRTGILKLWDRRGFAYCYHKFSRGVQVLHIVSTNSGVRGTRIPRCAIFLTRKEYPKVR